MNKTLILSLLIISSINSQALDTFSPQEIAHLNWGTAMGEVALSKAPGNNFGSQSFFVADNSLYLLDAANQRIVVFDIQTNSFSSIPLSLNGADDFCLLNEHYLYVLFGEEMKIRLYDWTGKVEQTLSINQDIEPLRLQCNQGLILEAFDGHFYRLHQKTALLHIPVGNFAFTVTQHNDFWTIESIHNHEDIFIKSQRGSIELLNIIGIDAKQHLYIIVEEILDDEKVLRFLQKYSLTGDLLASVELPYSLYAYTLKDLIVTPLGDVFQILPFKKGLEIVQWATVDKGLDSKSLTSSNYQQNLFSHTEEQENDFLPSETEDSELDGKFTKGFNQKITRQKIIKQAKAYVNYKFYVGRNNLTRSSGIYDYNRNKWVITPMRRTGYYKGVPYKWGGDDSLGRFKQGLQSGKKAGDKCTAKNRKCRGQYFGSSKAVGVDCSGFISRVWNVYGKYGTRNLPNISIRLRSKHDLQAGDILNKKGHVRLFSHKSRGRFYVYEATASHGLWKVVMRSYASWQLKKYKPYRYKYIDERISYDVSEKKPVRLYIYGKTRLTEDSSTSYRAKMFYSDGSLEDVTKQTSWSEKSRYAYFKGSKLYTRSVPRSKSVFIKASYTKNNKTFTSGVRIAIRNSYYSKSLENNLIPTKLKELDILNTPVSVTFWLNSPGQKQFTSSDRINLNYTIKGISHNKPVYLSLFNISPQGKLSLLIENQQVNDEKQYSFPKSSASSASSTSFTSSALDFLLNQKTKQIRLEIGEEYFKAIVSTTPIQWESFFREDTPHTALLAIKVLKVEVQ